MPLPGGRFEVRTEDGVVASCDAPGEIVYHGPNVMLGYAEQRGDLARGDELHGTLETGDLGYVDADGCLFVTGRSKRIAKVFGLRVSLDDLEARLAAVGPVALVGGDDAVLVFVPEERAAVVATALAALAADMKVHHSGFRMTTVTELPLLPSGKVDYTRLRASLTERPVPVMSAR
jgi:acyl-CoA synthetase (AMP-forming)/AMP-acid ligase II